MMRYFDTHAILGVLKGEPAYRAFQSTAGLTHPMNLLEAMVRLLRLGDATPLATVKTLRLGVVESIDADLIAAASFKMQNRPGLSHVDALGYAIAKRLGIPFLTGDAHFREVEGVEFVSS